MPPSADVRLTQSLPGLSRGRGMAALFSLATSQLLPPVPEARPHCPTMGWEAAGRETRRRGRGTEAAGLVEAPNLPTTHKAKPNAAESLLENGGRERERGARRLGHKAVTVPLPHPLLPTPKSVTLRILFFLDMLGEGLRGCGNHPDFVPPQATRPVPACFLMNLAGAASRWASSDHRLRDSDLGLGSTSLM